MNSFTETGLHDGILNAVQELGFEKPTPIQTKAIPHLLSTDQDLMALFYHLLKDHKDVQY